MSAHDTLLSQSSTDWRFVVLLALICAYTLFIWRPTVWQLQMKYFETLPSVYGTRVNSSRVSLDRSIARSIDRLLGKPSIPDSSPCKGLISLFVICAPRLIQRR